MKSFHKIFIVYMIFAVMLGTFGWRPMTAKAYTTVSEWRFNGSYADSVGTHTGTANGTGISVSNNYLSLTSGGQDYVSVADANDLSFTSGLDSDLPFSISAWVKKTGGGNGVVIVSKTNNTADSEYLFRLGNDDILYFYLFDDSHTVGNWLLASADLAALYPDVSIDNEWIHLTATYDGSALTTGVKLYLNGSLINSTNAIPNSYSGMAAGASTVKIGSSIYSDSTAYSDGSIDELKLASTVMTPTEVSAIFNDESANYRHMSLNAKFLDASGNNVNGLSASPATTEIKFTPVMEINAGDGILISFESGFVLGTFDGTETAVTQIHNTTDIILGTVGKSSQDARIIVNTAGDMKAEEVTVTITGEITTPDTADTYTVSVKMYDLGSDGAWGGVDGAADTLESTATSAVVFGSYNVDISATVEPTLTLTLGDWYSEPQTYPPTIPGTAGNCSLGTLIATENRLCVYSVTVDTNSAGGYTAFIRDTGNFASGANEMADSSGTISPGTEGYGIATSKSGYTVSQINDFDGGGVSSTDVVYLWGNRATTSVNASAATTSDQSFSGASAPVDNDQAILMHMVNISGITFAGSYTTTTIITVVGNF